jgi:hypothetical protein
MEVVANAPRRRVLVLDGHDGAGKTTLAARMAQVLGGVHIQPFAGTLGQLFLWASTQGDATFASELARRAVEYAFVVNDAPLLVFDRHWMTVFSVLPKSYWLAWEPLPPTALCWVSLETTISRLATRGDVEVQPQEHIRYLSIYRELGRRFGCYMLRTDQLSIEESLEELLKWAKSFL